MNAFVRRPARAASVLTTGALALAAVVAGPATVTSAAAAAVTASGVSVAPAGLTLSRLETGSVTVELDLVVGGGQRTSYRRDGVRYTVPALVDRASGTRALPRTPLDRVSGTDANGHWSAAVPVGAVNRGAHTLAVEVCPAAVDCTANGPVTVSLGEGVDVTGTDWPELVGLVQDPQRLPRGEWAGAEATGQVRFSASGDPAPGVDVALVRSPGELPDLVDTTGAAGRFRAPWPWPLHDVARLVAVTPTADGLVTHDVARLRAPATSFDVSVGSSPAVIHSGDRWQVAGRVAPGVAATRLGGVQLQRRTDNGWRTIERATLDPLVRDGRTTRIGTFAFSHRFDLDGQLTLRVRKPGSGCTASGCRIRPGTSGRIVVVVGSPAYLVERRLASLGVPVGTVDGVIDVRARQALCAWRDMAGRRATRDGLTPSLARSVLSAHRLPRPDRSDGLYVNKTCQVLLQVVDHRFRRVVWVSTGSPGYDTPVGTGAIFRKLQGPIESTLYPEAYMYDPMFFLPSRPGIALHGSVSNSLVLPYPASHGCIRVWRPQMHRIAADSPIGTKVKVYGTY